MAGIADEIGIITGSGLIVADPTLGIALRLAAIVCFVYVGFGTSFTTSWHSKSIIADILVVETADGSTGIYIAITVLTLFSFLVIDMGERTANLVKADLVDSSIA